MSSRKTPSARELMDAALRGELDEACARQLAAFGPDVVSMALLAASQQIAEQNRQIIEQRRRIAERDARIGELTSGSAHVGRSSSTPSGMIPPYQKPPASKKPKKPGAKKGHTGTRRRAPAKIDRRETHRVSCCPDCGGRVQRCDRRRTRIIEDIPESIEPVVTEHTIHRDYCPHCKKHVEPVVPDAMPRAMIGHRLVALTGWFHYGLGITVDQIVKILGSHLQTRLTPGGLVQAWHRLGDVLRPWYETIAEQAKTSAHLHADETGWRVKGQTHWLWCFANHQVCYYMIDRSRGSPALQAFFTEAFDGVLITDFWSAYGSVAAEDRQYCLVHLLRELDDVDQRNGSAEWQSFARRLRALLREGINLRKRPTFKPGKWQDHVDRLNKRLAKLASAEPGRSGSRDGSAGRSNAGGAESDADVCRLKKRLAKYAEYIFTFLDYDHVPFENNFAERQIRPAVIIRKNSLSNRSDRGATTQAVLMSIYQTLKLRDLDPTKPLVDALREYVRNGKLPDLPC